MSLVPVFQAIKAQLLATVTSLPPFTSSFDINNSIEADSFEGGPPVPFVQMWNNQLEKWKSQYVTHGKVADMTHEKQFDTIKKDSTTYSVNFPALLIEFAHAENTEMGWGVQIYDDLVVRIHIVHQELDATDGTMEQNLNVYALADAVQCALNKFKIPQCSEMIRLRHEMDWNHNQLYHYIIDYGMNYTDTSQYEPVNGNTLAAGTLKLKLTESYDPSPFLKSLNI